MSDASMNATGNGAHRKTVTVIGMGVAAEDLTEAHWGRIRAADLLIGGKRHLAAVSQATAERRVIDRDLTGLVRAIRERAGTCRIVVLASGDPLFYGIGDFLIRELGAEAIEILPNISAVAAAFSRLGRPWQDAVVVSLHGRERFSAVTGGLLRGKPVAVYTDFRRHPAWIAERLCEAGFSRCPMTVFSAMGGPDERRRACLPEEAVDLSFEEPSLVVLLPDPSPAGGPLRPGLGMPESAFAHEAGMITKREVRVVSLSRLDLGPDLTLWDLGAGSGSVSIEASVLMPGGGIFAVERRSDRIGHIRENKRRFGAGGLTIVPAELPDALDALPDPDRIFIGGGGARLPGILAVCGRRLAPGGRIVINTVILENLNAAASALDDLGWAFDCVQIQVGRTRSMADGRRLEALNPVWILSARKPEGR